MADDIDPATRFQRLDDLCRDGHAADVFDVAAGHGLPVGNDGNCFHHRARVARRLFREEPLEIGLQLGAGLEAPTARQADEFDSPALPLLGDLRQELAQRIDVELAFEQPFELDDAQRLGRGQERRFEDALGFRRAGHRPILRKSARNIRPA